MISVIFSRLIILVFGVLYPAYASYKAVRTRDVKKYVQWMMYWIVFAFFTCIETFTDIFLSWFPFYYEVKVILVIWLLSPATKGSSTLYRKFVHPMLTRRESEIDEYLSQAKEKSYSTMMELGSKGVNYATSVIMQTAIKSMTNLGSARDLMGKLSGDQPDGGRTITQKISYRVIEGDEANNNNHQETPRNKRSVSVDSGLFREKGGVTYEERMAQRTIPEGDENVSEPEEGRTRRSNKGGDDGGDGGKAKVKRTAKTNSGSRLRGRAGIH